MKTTLSRFSQPSMQNDAKEQPVRLIKAAQASKILAGHGHLEPIMGASSHAAPEIRLVGTGADYCDLEVICGCGESTRIRCWNSPSAAAAK
jgi:hypothetical protein